MSAEPIGRPEPPPEPPPEMAVPRPREAAGGGPIAPSLHPGSGHEEVPRYRRRGIVLRHRRGSRTGRLVRRLLVVLLLVTTPLLVMWWLATAPSFALREVRPVESPEGPLRRVPADFIETRLEPLLGVNLFRLSLEEVQRRLDHPWVAGVAVGKELPGALRVTLVERQPVALAEAAEGFWYLDAEGHPIARCCETEAPPSLLRVAGARSPKDFAGALQVAAEARGLGLPWSENLQRVEVLGVDNYRLDLPALPFALLVRAGSLEGKVEYLTLLFPELVARYQSIEAVDLRFRERVVVRPGEPAEPSISPVPDGQTDRG